MSDTGTPFADADPEDGWDASDPVADQLANIVARLYAIDLILRGVDGGRAARLFDDLETIRQRIIARDLD